MQQQRSHETESKNWVNKLLTLFFFFFSFFCLTTVVLFDSTFSFFYNFDSQATNLGWERSEPKTISDERIQNGYQVRPGERICRSYLQTGLCDHGSNCLFNHPTCKVHTSFD